MAETHSARNIAYSRAPFSTWLGIVFLFILFGLIVLAVIGPSPRTSDYEESRAKKRIEKLKALNEEAQKDLMTYAWVDKGKGVARIPIVRAMEVTVTELAQKKPAAAGPIAAPAAQPLPAAAPSTGGSPAPAAPQQPGTAQPPQPSAPAGSASGQTAAPPLPAQQPPTTSASPAPAATP